MQIVFLWQKELSVSINIFYIDIQVLSFWTPQLKENKKTESRALT